MNQRAGRLRIATALLAVAPAFVGCDDSDSRTVTDGDQRALLDPCGRADHPCTLAEVTPEARALTEALAEQVGDRLASPADLEDAAAWLAEQEDVVSVAQGPGAIRYRVRGGRGRWILIQTLDSPATLGAPLTIAPGGSTAGSGSRSVSVRPSPAPTGAGAAIPAAVEGTTKGKKKKALLLSPFRWQWEIGGDSDGLDEIEQMLSARDYRDGVTLWSEHLDPDNPACAPGAVRWDECRTLSNFPLDAFTTWAEGYDYIHLVTHGAAASADGKTETAVMTPWTVDQLQLAEQVWSEAPESEGRTETLGLLNRMGLEDGYVFVYDVAPEAVPWVGEGQTVDFDVTLEKVLEAERGGPVPLNPTLSEDEQILCRRALERTPDSRRIIEGSGNTSVEERMHQVNGKLCGQYVGRVKTGPFLILTTQFFKATYPNGIGDAVIVMSACSSGFRRDMLRALDGDNTVVLGWTQTVSIGAAAEAGKLIASKLIQVDETVEDDSGLTVAQAMQAVRDLLDEATANAPTQEQCLQQESDPDIQADCALQYGDVLAVINERPADAVTGAMLAMVGDTTVRAREIVYLVDESGADLEDGSSLLVVGAADDGRPDSLDLRIRVDGLGLEEQPDAVDLHVVFENRQIAVERRLEKQVKPGVWELEYRLPIGRDHEDGEVVDLELVGELPDGGDSRWLYEDIRLTGVACDWMATVSGPLTGFAGTHQGYAYTLGNALIASDPESGWEAWIELPSSRPDPGRYTVAMRAVVHEEEDPNYPGEMLYGWAEGPATVGINRVEDGWIGGTVESDGLLWSAYSHNDTEVEVTMTFRAVPYAVRGDSSFRRCAAGWD